MGQQTNLYCIAADLGERRLVRAVPVAEPSGQPSSVSVLPLAFGRQPVGKTLRVLARGQFLLSESPQNGSSPTVPVKTQCRGPR